jgi:outer membrane protein W
MRLFTLTFLFGMNFHNAYSQKINVMKRAMIVAAILSVGFISKAQTVSFGPTGGFSHSWISGTTGDGKFNPAWNAGISFVYSTKSHFGIGADVKYSAEGNKTEDLGVTNTINTNYVRVPLKAIYFFGKQGNTVRPKISAGPTFGFLTNANATTSVEGTKVKTDITDDVKGFDFGVNAAAGLNFRVAQRTWLNTELAYYQGLTDITKNSNTTSRNGNVGVNVGLLVGLGK